MKLFLMLAIYLSSCQSASKKPNIGIDNNAKVNKKINKDKKLKFVPNEFNLITNTSFPKKANNYISIIKELKEKDIKRIKEDFKDICSFLEVKSSIKNIYLLKFKCTDGLIISLEQLQDIKDSKTYIKAIEPNYILSIH